MIVLMNDRRARLVTEVERAYGVALYPHPRRPSCVVISDTDYDKLEAAVMSDSRLSPIGRGYYLYLGGELSPVRVRDWMCDRRIIAVLRRRARRRRAVRRLLQVFRIVRL